MAINHVQFQAGLSMMQFIREYGTDAKGSKGDGGN